MGCLGEQGRTAAPAARGGDAAVAGGGPHLPPRPDVTAQEMPFVGLLPDLRGQTVFEASGMASAKGKLFVVGARKHGTLACMEGRTVHCGRP